MPHRVPTAPADRWGPLPRPHHDHRRSRGPSLRTRVERWLFVVAAACLGYYGYVRAEMLVAQQVEDQALTAILRSAPEAAREASAADDAVHPELPEGALVGRVEIPRLGLETIVRAGSEAETLRLAVGLIPGTAWPGEHGNVELAGHRDTFFRKLRDIQPSDEIVVTTPEGRHTYVVERTFVVEPTDVWVLDPTPAPALTLVTCYPFTWIGSAPRRFIVRAALRVP